MAWFPIVAPLVARYAAALAGGIVASLALAIASRAPAQNAPTPLPMTDLVFGYHYQGDGDPSDHEYILDNTSGTKRLTQIGGVWPGFQYPNGTAGATVNPGHTASLPEQFLSFEDLGSAMVANPAPPLYFPLPAGAPILQYQYGTQTVSVSYSVPNVTVVPLDMSSSGLVPTTLVFGAQNTATTVALNNVTYYGGTIIVGSNVNAVVGTISGPGTTEIDAGASLTANRINGGTLSIGSTASMPATVTINASDSNGNPLAAIGGLGVPEPSSFLLAILAIAGGAAILARRVKRIAACQMPRQRRSMVGRPFKAGMAWRRRWSSRSDG